MTNMLISQEEIKLLKEKGKIRAQAEKDKKKIDEKYAKKRNKILQKLEKVEQSKPNSIKEKTKKVVSSTKAKACRIADENIQKIIDDGIEQLTKDGAIVEGVSRENDKVCFHYNIE